MTPVTLPPSSDLVPPPNGDNLTGDIVELGIKRNAPEFHDDLRWWFRYSIAQIMTQADCARQLGVDGGTYSKVFRGAYANAQGLVLSPPAKMLSRIRVLRAQDKAFVEKRSAGRVLTPTVQEIHDVCRKAWDDGQIAFVFGESHMGKTFSALWFRDENNHGATIYVDLQGCGGEQDVYRNFARALKISADVPIAKLKPRVHSAIDRTNLVLVDEFHVIGYAYQKAGSTRMINVLKAIKDICHCAMVIFSTNVGRDEFDLVKGHEAQYLKQLWRRGVIKLQLPEALRVGDVRAFATAYGLDFPGAPKGGADTWKRLNAEHPQFPGLKTCEHIAYNCGVKHLVSVFEDGNKIATKRGHDLDWTVVAAAQRFYDVLSAKKEV
jgi:DNA transposition AAA+ family ATPase